MIDAESGSRGATGDPSRWFVGARAGLKVMMHPMRAGIIRVGIDQWRRTSQNVDV
jgi:hypothetical protein